jgi:hypothetical protein
MKKIVLALALISTPAAAKSDMETAISNAVAVVQADELCPNRRPAPKAVRAAEKLLRLAAPIYADEIKEDTKLGLTLFMLNRKNICIEVYEHYGK